MMTHLEQSQGREDGCLVLVSADDGVHPSLVLRLRQVLELSQQLSQLPVCHVTDSLCNMLIIISIYINIKLCALITIVQLISYTYQGINVKWLMLTYSLEAVVYWRSPRKLVSCKVYESTIVLTAVLINLLEHSGHTLLH